MKLKRGMIIDVNLDPTLGSETVKIRPCIDEAIALLEAENRNQRKKHLTKVLG